MGISFPSPLAAGGSMCPRKTRGLQCQVALHVEARGHSELPCSSTSWVLEDLLLCPFCHENNPFLSKRHSYKIQIYLFIFFNLKGGNFPWIFLETLAITEENPHCLKASLKLYSFFHFHLSNFSDSLWENNRSQKATFRHLY